jgi:hypothetical protein
VAQQNLDFNIIAHTKGMEAIATMINRVGALEAETKRLASANATLSASTDTVIRNGVRYNNAMDAQSRALRQNRQGTQQLGMQINDFATSVSSGSSVTQAFTQQLGQVGYAMSQMGGIAGRIGGFLAGPWGAAVLIGAMALGPIIEKLFQSEDAANKAADAHYKYLDAVASGNMADLIKAEGELTKLQERRMIIGTKADKANRGLLFGGSLFPKSPKKEMEEIDQQIRWYELAVQRGNKAREELSKVGKKTSSLSLGGGGRSSSGQAKKEDVENLSQVNIIERNQASIRSVLDKGTKYWQDYYDNIELISVPILQQIAEDSEMVTAKIQTIGDAAGPIFLDRATEIQNAFANVGMAVNNAFKGMLTGAMSWKDGIKGIIGSVIDELWRLYVVQQIVGFVTKAIGGVTGNPGPTLSASDMAIQVTRGKAVGGYVAAQTPYVVGEKGPELFVPGGSGTIIPNKNMGGVGGGANGMVINVDARGASDPAAVRAQVQQGILEAAPAIIAAAESRTVAGLRRPRLGGVMQ